MENIFRNGTNGHLCSFRAISILTHLAQILASVGGDLVALHHADGRLAHFLRVDDHLDVPFVTPVKAETDESALARIDKLHQMAEVAHIHAIDVPHKRLVAADVALSPRVGKAEGNHDGLVTGNVRGFEGSAMER